MTKIFNRQAFLQRVGGDEELIQELVDIFLEYVPPQLQEIRQACEAGDAWQLQGKAHSLKGAAASISAEGIKEVAGQLELAGRHGALTEVSPLLEALNLEFSRLKEFLVKEGWEKEKEAMPYAYCG